MKRLMLVLVFIFSFSATTFAENGDTEYEKEFSTIYDKTEFSETYNQTYEDIKNSKFSISPKAIFEKVKKTVKQEITNTKSLFLTLFGVIILSGFAYITEKSNITYGVMNLISVTMATLGVSRIILLVTDIAKNAVLSVNSFSTKLAPMISVLLVSSGYTATSKAFYPVFSFFIWLMGMLLNEVIIPLVFCGAVVGIVNTFSTSDKLKGLGNFSKSMPKWILLLLLTGFTSINAIYGFATPSVDSVGVKCAKFAIGNGVPVVGGFLSDSLETVMMTSSMIKNVVGTAGIVTLITIASFPIVRIIAITFCLWLLSLVCDVLSIDTTKKVIREALDVCKIMMALVVTSTVIFVISLAIIMNSTNILV